MLNDNSVNLATTAPRVCSEIGGVESQPIVVKNRVTEASRLQFDICIASFIGSLTESVSQTTWYVASSPLSISDRPETADAVLYQVTTTAASARNIWAPATPSERHLSK